jgi:hypothetical protein
MATKKMMAGSVQLAWLAMYSSFFFSPKTKGGSNEQDSSVGWSASAERKPRADPAQNQYRTLAKRTAVEIQPFSFTCRGVFNLSGLLYNRII